MFLTPFLNRWMKRLPKRCSVVQLNSIPERQLQDMGISRLDLIEAMRQR